MFTPSKYQQDIFTALQQPGGDILVEAVAGSGKTTTLIEGLCRLPLATVTDTLLCAFNKEIERTLQAKAPEGVTVKTNHALGFACLANYFAGKLRGRWNPKVDDRKYRYLIEKWFVTHIREKYDEESDGEKEMFSLVHFCRVTLTDPSDKEAVLAMARDRELLLPEADIMLRALPMILEWGMKGTGTRDEKNRNFSPEEMIDFDDMVWLPFVFDAEPRRKFRLVMVDEAQDLNAAQRQLVFRHRAPGGRIVFVGDPFQAIYGFCGADYDSFRQIGEITGAKRLPLSVCYRCPESVIDLAQEIVPHIEAAPDAARGVVDHIKQDTFEQIVSPADMVLCRVNAPMISMAFALIAAGKAAKVRGRDIGAQLVKTVDQIEKLSGFHFPDFIASAEIYRLNQVRVLSQKDNAEMQIASLHDRVNSVNAVFEAAIARGAEKVGDLRAYIHELFTEEEDGCILLSSIHKAKGLEALRVFILCPEYLPHPMAKTKAAREQEENLRYVAYTRALGELYIVHSETNR